MAREEEVQPGVVVRGVRPTPLRDVYHRFLRMGWGWALLLIACAILLVNLGFGGAYFVVGGVENMRPGVFADAFFFSVQTLATIGYGNMYPAALGAHVLVTLESTLGIVLTALATGLVFAKFALSGARISFSRTACIAPMNGVPTFMFRVGNQRGNSIVEAMVRVAVFRTEHTREGETFYRMYDLPLVRERSPAIARSWTALHTITEASLLYGLSPADFERDELEFVVTMMGTDDTSFQAVHASRTYTVKDIAWGMRPADILSEQGGTLIVDLTRFHELTPTEACEGFPYAGGVRVADERPR